MSSKKLDREFEKAVEFMNSYHDPLPADLLLRLYAYYKKATRSEAPPGSRRAIINAFKTNALFQAGQISEKQAKKKYTKLVSTYFNEDFKAENDA
ncbi:acyl-CoA-binding protein [Robertkochia marina]|uniref:Acyl-CoA-binding protein n=1 Tax=Robertkochia marina TaxID=1227945 RepID=A0A4S3LXT1_9FLAO|nr:acyl-CoA-binding protein [Robertkochia marina]THD66369.1 acyl-CoA-binding protein [Robertkochia marina]TRZ44049.1 acyl-CoA-binding protein [Robertkochia marina]